MARPRSTGMTVYSLARAAGVSPATVSKVFNNHPDVSDEARARVQQLAGDFRPQAIDRRVANVCALIQQEPGHDLDLGPWLAEALEGVADYTREEGLEFSLHARDASELGRGTLARELRRRRVDAAVVFRANTDSRWLAALRRQKFPFACVLADDGAHTDHLITVSNHEVGAIAARHLIELKHREAIVLVTARGSTAGEERFAGFAAAWGTRRLHRIDPSSSEDSLAIGARDLPAACRAHPRATAAFCMDLSVAIGALHGLREAGIAVPSDCSLIACDDAPIAGYLEPGLTTVAIPNRRLGWLAARRAHRLLRHVTDESETLAPTLVVRHTTGAPRSPAKA